MSFVICHFFALGLENCLVTERFQLVGEFSVESALGFGWQIGFLRLGYFR